MRGPVIAPDDILALSFVPRVSRSRLAALLDGIATVPQSLEALIDYAGKRKGSAQCALYARRAAAGAVERAKRNAVEPVVLGTPRYPPLLAAIFDPPLVLWVRGDIAALSEPLLAIVGSRAASPYGESVASSLASDLCRRGFAVSSGMARGIDAAAHRGALAAGGRTVAVLGCGTDIAYPPEHALLRDEVARHGAVISEFPPGTPPRAMHFPMRNRIISGLSMGVVVVEAPHRSGALITADCALEQGREVMAVPGSVLGERHRGSNRLLKEGAALVETASDVLDALGFFDRPVACQPCPEAEQDRLLAVLDPAEGMDLDQLAGASGSNAAALLPRLLDLELQGLVHRLPGGRFVRSDGTC